METSAPPRLAINLSASLYYHLVYTLTALLPPPVDDTPEGLQARNHTAIAKVAALLPVNANEADLAAQCIAARAQAEDVLRLLRHNAHNVELVMRLNAQYSSMVRTSLSVHARLMRVQALRQKREAIEASANQDAWTLHIAERSMLEVVNADAGPQQAASGQVAQAAPAQVPRAAPGEPPEAVQAALPKAAADVAPLGAQYISPNETKSQHEAFETWLNAQIPDRASSRLHQVVREAMAGPESPAKAHESPGMAA